MRDPANEDHVVTRWADAEGMPTHWEVRRLKFIATCNDEALPESTDLDLEVAYVDISSVDLVRGITAVAYQTFEQTPSRRSLLNQ